MARNLVKSIEPNWYPEWIGRVRQAVKVYSDVRFELGDLLLEAEGKGGEFWSQAAADIGLSENTLMQYARTSRMFPPHRREAFFRAAEKRKAEHVLTFSHFQIVANRIRNTEEQDGLLAAAIEQQMNSREITDSVSAYVSENKQKSTLDVQSKRSSKTPKTIDVKAERVAEADLEQPVFDRASAARDITPPKQKEEATPAETAKPASVSVRFTRIIVDILALEHNPVLAADLLKEKFDRIDDLNQAIFRLMQTRDALLRGGEKVSRWPHKSEIEGSTPSPATNPSAAAEVQEEAPPTPPTDLDTEPSTPHRHGQDISTGGEMPDLPASLKREKEATHGR